MAKVVKHAWTHRPRSQGGTDPIEFPAGSEIIWGYAYSGPETVSDASNVYKVTFRDVYSNSATAFEAGDVTAGRADWLQINEPGYYVAQFSIIHNSSTFPDTNGGFIYPVFELGGSLAGFSGNMGNADFTGSQFSPAGYIMPSSGDEPGLWQTLTFNWDPDNPDVGSLNDENPLKIGVAWTEVSGDATYTMTGGVFVYRISDPGFVDLSPA